MEVFLNQTVNWKSFWSRNKYYTHMNISLQEKIQKYLAFIVEWISAFCRMKVSTTPIMYYSINTYIAAV